MVFAVVNIGFFSSIHLPSGYGPSGRHYGGQDQRQGITVLNGDIIKSILSKRTSVIYEEVIMQRCNFDFTKVLIKVMIFRKSHGLDGREEEGRCGKKACFIQVRQQEALHSVKELVVLLVSRLCQPQIIE